MSRTGKILIYGATGYTGKLTARTAKAQGLAPVLAGRNAEKVEALGKELGLEWRAFDLSNREALDKALSGVAAVLHIAGPFSATSKLMADACLRTGTHYLDVTGEIAVFEDLARRDAEAKAAGVMLLPGAGFDVVPSDCLAAHLKRRMPDATDLKMYVSGLSGISRGTAKTGVESIGAGTLVRRDGEIIALDGINEDLADFGEGPRPTFAVSWGDVSTAWHSTGIPNIEIHFEAVPALARLAKLPSLVRAFLGLRVMQALLKRQIDRQPEGPSEDARKAGRSVIVGSVRNAKGDIARSRLRTPEVYSLTALTGLAMARRAANGEAKPGFQTPSTMFGADFVLEFEGVSREDLNS